MTDNIIFCAFRSSTLALEVYCSWCDGRCSYAYPLIHEEVAYWTIGRKEILCPDCAKLVNSKRIYRKVYLYGDLPHRRTQIRILDGHMFNLEYVENHFCSRRVDELECKGKRMIKSPLCDCRECNPNPGKRRRIMKIEY